MPRGQIAIPVASPSADPAPRSPSRRPSDIRRAWRDTPKAARAAACRSRTATAARQLGTGPAARPGPAAPAPERRRTPERRPGSSRGRPGGGQARSRSLASVSAQRRPSSVASPPYLGEASVAAAAMPRPSPPPRFQQPPGAAGAPRGDPAPVLQGRRPSFSHFLAQQRRYTAARAAAVTRPAAATTTPPPAAAPATPQGEGAEEPFALPPGTSIMVVLRVQLAVRRFIALRKFAKQRDEVAARRQREYDTSALMFSVVLLQSVMRGKLARARARIQQRAADAAAGQAAEGSQEP
eukprot:TRINITY_DN16077_c0_g1_i1.p1 TRINITY_DN16077_c0_g1~~TRINITY_DN16077_c0_g1_i1.p1  ORF type:complete len:295 (+),score=30.98 TRINITY_DN16077_c0_g1_i1:111-995(+)